jgi:ubiquinone/menaquinone biosynthesis C-methylase UbiE
LVILLKRRFKTSRKKKEIIKNYDLTAHFYDKRYKTIQEEKYSLVLNNFPLNEKRVLDVGCGTGLLIEYILNIDTYNRELRSNFVALDISWKMLLKFKSKLYKLKNKSNISLILSDIENLPFRDNTFNVLFSFTSFQNLPGTHEGIQELIRVAKMHSDLKFSILKKKLQMDILINFLEPYLEDLELFEEDFLEDIIIQGIISKK